MIEIHVTHTITMSPALADALGTICELLTKQPTPPLWQAEIERRLYAVEVKPGVPSRPAADLPAVLETEPKQPAPPAVATQAAIEAPPIPPADPVVSPRGAWRTSARRELLIRDWPTFRTTADIAAEMEPLGPVPVDNVAVWAAELGLKRPDGFLRKMAEMRGLAKAEKPRAAIPQQAPRPSQPATPPAPKPVVTAAANPGTREADFTQIEQWAAVRGIAFDGDNLDAVNAKRQQFGLPIFVMSRVRQRA